MFARIFFASFHASTLKGLPTDVVTNWRTFVEGDLALLNEAQKITKVGSCSRFLLLISPNQKLLLALFE